MEGSSDRATTHPTQAWLQLMLCGIQMESGVVLMSKSGGEEARVEAGSTLGERGNSLEGREARLGRT